MVVLTYINITIWTQMDGVYIAKSSIIIDRCKIISFNYMYTTSQEKYTCVDVHINVW